MNNATPALMPFHSERVEWVIDRPFAAVLRQFSATLRKPSLLKMALFVKLKRIQALRAYLNHVGGEDGLMILGSIPHGSLLGLLGGPSQARMFLVGNPLIALTMMRIHPQAGVYAPLRVMFSGDSLGRTIITYDRPSMIFGQWTEPVFQETGKMLDLKMENLLCKIGLPQGKSSTLNLE
jgi:uncharacterized protein (DUF302 family)